MVPFGSIWSKAAAGVDWLIRGQFVVQILIALGIGKVVQWVAIKYAQIPPTLASAIWLIVSGLLVWLSITLFGKRAFVQETSLEIVAASGGIEDNIKAVAAFYKTGGGPFLDEIEAHFQRLAAHHRDAREREQFLVRALASGAASYLHDMTWASIFKSQLDALTELNTNGAMITENLRAFYTAAAALNPETYSNYRFESWLDYLLSQTLIRRDGDVIQITVRGKDFLKYLVQSGRSANSKRN